MKKNLIILGIFFLHLQAALCPAVAEEKKDKPADPVVSTSHVMLPGVLPLAYKATTGYLTLKNDKGASTARIFYVAYERRGSPAARRPVTFAFNGGPGSSSVWLHLGALGPRRVALNDDGTPPPPPARLIANGDTWLAFTDLVFIDPVGTGYSRPSDEKNEKQFYDMKADIESVGEFIRLYLSRCERWASPVYLCGESYGTTRAVGLLSYLHEKSGISPSGLILISPVLDFSTIGFQQTNDTSLALALPTYAATAWHFGKTRSEFPQQSDALAAAEQFSLGQYLGALALGRSIDPGARAAAAGQVARIAGLAKDYVLDNNLRIASNRFRKELLRSGCQIIGRMDSRISMPDTDRAGDATWADPSLERLCGPFATAMNDYLRRDLKFTEDLPYWYLNSDVVNAWNWRTGMQAAQGYVDVSQQLTDALHFFPSLRVLIAAGLYDLATPYFGAVYTINHLPLDASRAGNIKLITYPAGHMLYAEPAVLRRLSRDVQAFYRNN